MSKPLFEQIARGARPIVADRKRRVRHVEAVDVSGEECDPCDARAVRFCAVGALIRSGFEVTGDWEQAHVLGWRLAGMIERANGLGTEDDDGYGLVKLSDMRGGRAVVTALDVFLAGDVGSSVLKD